MVLVSSRFGQVNRANTWEGIQTFEDDVILTGSGSDIIIPSGSHIRLDGSPSGDTSLTESSANVVDLRVGGSVRIRSTTNDTILRMDINEISDGTLLSTSVGMWLNEVGNVLNFKVKYADSSVKAGTVALS